MEGRETAASPSPPAPEGTLDTRSNFDIAAMHTWTVVYTALNWLFDYPQREYWMGFFRRFWPIVRIPFSGVIVFRDEDVREVLTHDREFPVPWAEKMMALSRDKNFVLGMEDGPEYRRSYQILAKAFRREDIATIVVPLAAKASADILRGKKRIDAVRDLLWYVPSQLCEDYYGIEIPDKLLFAEWTIAMSSYLFKTWSNAVETSGKALAVSAADGFLNLIRTAIRKAREGDSPGVILPRLIKMEDSEPELADAFLEARLFGMVTGFVPTNLLAAGYILSTLLHRDDFMAHARDAARNDDDDLLWRCLQETLRFRNINPGPFRRCGEDGYTLAAGTRRAKTIAPHTGILAGTQSAMFDSRRIARPRHFDPNRPAEDYLVFGYGQHWCLGAHLANAQLTQTFKALLRMPGLRRAPGSAGKLRLITLFPAHLWVEFDS